MKKSLLILTILLSMAGYLAAQTIEDFEVIPMNVMTGGADDQSNFYVIPNPDPSGINTSSWAAKLVRDKDGVPWCGFWSPLPVPVDVTVNKYVHVKVWKPRISPIKFKLEGGAAGTLEIASMNPQTVVNGWEDIVFDFSSKTGTYPIIAFMPDFADPVNLTEDIMIYFDDIYVNNDPTPNSAPGYVIEDYQMIPLNPMLGGANDNSSFIVVPNPVKQLANSSNWVCRFYRSQFGVPWGGFWSPLPVPVDVTTNKYVHAKVWKPRISPVKFKLEGGAAGTLETESMYPQTTIGFWEDMVFDFTSKTGTYPIIAFMPDFADPVGLTEDIVIFFDDIRVDNSSNPFVGVENVKKSGGVTVYPTPFKDNLVININEEVLSVTMSSALGQQVISYQNPSMGKLSANTSNLSSGIYFLNINPKSGTPYTIKVIKQ